MLGHQLHTTQYTNLQEIFGNGNGSPKGVKQGDNISATLFSIFINDLAEEIKATGIGLALTENVANVKILREL